MHLRTIQYFLAIADAGSFTAAAAAIPLAQPALTRQMRDLEKDMGVQLLQRLPRGVLLTPAGVTFYESAQRILNEAAMLRQRLSHQKNNQHARVVLGVSPTLARVLLPGLLENCFNILDKVELRTREAFTPALMDWLEKGVIDMAIMTNPGPGRNFSYLPLLGEPFALVSNKSMRLGSVVSIHHLIRIPLLMTSLHRHLVEKQMQALGMQLNVHSEIDSVDSIRELISRGPWATVMPVSVFKDLPVDTHITMSEISGIQINRMLVLATRMNAKSSQELSQVQELVESEVSRLMRHGVFSFGGSSPANLGV